MGHVFSLVANWRVAQCLLLRTRSLVHVCLSERPMERQVHVVSLPLCLKLLNNLLKHVEVMVTPGMVNRFYCSHFEQTGDCTSVQTKLHCFSSLSTTASERKEMTVGANT